MKNFCIEPIKLCFTQTDPPHSGSPLCIKNPYVLIRAGVNLTFAEIATTRTSQEVVLYTLRDPYSYIEVKAFCKS